MTEDDTALVRTARCWPNLHTEAQSTAQGKRPSRRWKLRVEVWRSVQHTVVADAYSTLCKTQTCRRSAALQKTADLTGRIPVTLDDDLPTPRGTVLGCFVTLGSLCHTG